MPHLARWMLPLVVALVAPACAASGPTSRVTALLGGAEAVSVLADRTPSVRREAFRIDGMAAMRPGGAPAATAVGGPNVHGFPILGGPVPVDDVSAVELASVLLDDDTYLWDVGKFCVFAPGVAIRETRGSTVVEVLICLSCDEIACYVNGTTQGPEDTDPRRADLVRIAQRLFPDDPKLLALE